MYGGEHMKNNKALIRLIMSIFSLCLAVCLIIVISFAWFLANTAVTAKIHVTVTGGKDLTILLEGYQGDEWKDIKEVSYESLNPGDKIYLRLVIQTSSSTDQNITAKYGKMGANISNAVSANIDSTATGDVKGHITYQGVDIMDILANDDSESDNPYAVYEDGDKFWEISSTGKITILDNYKIYNAMVSYDLGSSEQNLLPSQLSFTGKTPRALSEDIFGDGATVYAASTTYCYFAIEYIDYDSSSSAVKDYKSNNYFIYQTFNIETIDVFGK